VADAVLVVDVAQVDQAVDAVPVGQVADVAPADPVEIDVDVDQDATKKIQVSSSAL
jgi:hypothetical protein